ncbi:MAG: hypothetical protein OEM39_09970, partial [Acidimicrobiia bacterium]|nr:hypothetical protein [Acidimicrobiia bacterium]
MARSNHPPLPSAVRPLFWAIRVFGVLLGLGVLYVAALAVSQQRWDLLGLVLVLGGGFVALTWMPPASRWFLPTFAFVGLVVAIPLGSWTLALVVVVTIGLMVWLRRRPLRGLGMVNPDKIVAVAPESVMKNARTFVEEFRAAGFEQVGAIQFSIGPIKVIESLMIAPDGRSYAAVTDAVINVNSVYPGGRGLVTRNSAQTPLPDYLLVDNVPGG